MCIKELFAVPKGKKVTEKVFARVLLSSVCSILLCMACLVSTTWAWFAVSIENKGNVIEIATVTANVSVKQGDNEITRSENGSYTLDAGTYSLHIQLDNNATEPLSPVYVLLSVSQNGVPAKYYYIAFENGLRENTRELSVHNSSAVVTFSVSWVTPVSAAPLGAEAMIIGEPPTEPATDPSTEPSAETASPTTETSPAATTATQPVTNPTEAAATEATAATTATEAATEATAATTATEAATEATAATASTEVATETTGGAENVT